MVRGLSGLARVPARRPPASECALQFRDVSHPQPLGIRGPRAGDVPARLPLFTPLPAGNPPPRLAVSNSEKHVSHVLPAARAGAGSGGRRCAGLGRPDVPRRTRRRRAGPGGAHGPRTRHAAAARGVPDRAPARRGRGHAPGGSGADHELSGGDREVADLPGERAAPGTPSGLPHPMSEPRDLSDEALSHRLQTDLPRYAAPDRLHAAVLATARTRRRPVWMAPTLSALATAAVLLLFLLPVLPSSNRPDP